MEVVRLTAPPPTVGREELASWFEISVTTTYNRLPKLEREEGFPPKLPGTMGRWSRAAVIAWIDGRSGYEPPPASGALNPRTLEEIYGGAA